MEDCQKGDLREECKDEENGQYEGGEEADGDESSSEQRPVVTMCEEVEEALDSQRTYSNRMSRLTLTGYSQVASKILVAISEPFLGWSYCSPTSFDASV
jgi:hypothetical protein